MRPHTPIGPDLIRAFWQNVFWIGIGIIVTGLVTVHPYTFCVGVAMMISVGLILIENNPCGK